jgi:Integrase core domain
MEVPDARELRSLDDENRRLNEHLFINLKEAREIVEAWRIDYNTNRPHTSLNGLTPTEFAARPPTTGKTGTDSPYERGQLGEQVRSRSRRLFLFANEQRCIVVI